MHEAARYRNSHQVILASMSINSKRAFPVRVAQSYEALLVVFLEFNVECEAAEEIAEANLQLSSGVKELLSYGFQEIDVSEIVLKSTEGYLTMPKHLAVQFRLPSLETFSTILKEQDPCVSQENRQYLLRYSRLSQCGSRMHLCTL